MKPYEKTLLHRRNPYCVFCGCMTYYKEACDPGIRATVEHLFPRSLGGSDHPSNLAISCYACNKSRGASLGPPPRVKAEDLRYVPMPEITLLRNEAYVPARSAFVTA